MNVKTTKTPNVTSNVNLDCPELLDEEYMPTLTELLFEELSASVGSVSDSVLAVATRIALEVERMCHKSSRIQTSGQIRSWQIILGRNRLQKCLSYYRLGPKHGRIELHSNLSAMVYRYIALPQSQLSFQGRKNLIDDFLQEFYAASISAFRRENDQSANYTPRTQLELAEYMTFTENYAKRRINLPNGYSQQLIVLRVQAFAKRQPAETAVDIEQAVETQKGEVEQANSWSSAALQQVRSQIVTETIDPSDAMLRDRIIAELLEYLQSQGQTDCVDYLVLKLQDIAAPDIDAILGLTPRQRDYLQQRFKYHVDKFARASHWKLVHQWLGADIDQKLGMSSEQWQIFLSQLSPQHCRLLQLKKINKIDEEIAKELKWTVKQVQKQWMDLLELAWKCRNLETPKSPVAKKYTAGQNQEPIEGKIRCITEKTKPESSTRIGEEKVPRLSLVVSAS